MAKLTAALLRKLIKEEHSLMKVPHKILEAAVKQGLFKAAFKPLAFTARLEQTCQWYAETLSPVRRQALKALVLATQQHAAHEVELNEALVHEADGIRLLDVEREQLEADASRLNVERLKWWNKVFIPD